MNKVSRYGWNVNPGEILQTRMVLVERLKVDPSYQRTKLSEENVKGIARDFNWTAFRTVLVAVRPNGEMFVVDGQHRLEAAKRRGIKSIPCSIFASSGHEEEAMAFFTCATKVRTISALNKFRALLVGGDAETGEIEHLLSEVGLKVTVTPTNSPNKINFPAEIIRTFKVDSALTKTALVLQRIMIGPDTCMNREIHKGIFYVLHRQSITDKMAENVYKAGGKDAILHAINGTQIKSGNLAKSESICGLGVWEIVKKSSRLRVNLKGEAA